MDPDANKVDGQFELGTRGFSHSVIIVCETPNESGEPQVACLVRTVSMEGRPPLVETTRQTLFFPLPRGHLSRRRTLQMRCQPERRSWTKSRHHSYRRRIFVIVV